ncbi:MAG: TetR/AcrR family transcriptional regulator C-terminal domain-containing protein [Deltaproteobacteria bacterium]|nr:TetR/AcrR family transcriptional regulator C-terminal domain-containing protein [Deltaproteobacteria bacterium]
MSETKEKTKKRRRTPLSRDLILERALSLADKGGIEALSMRKLATALRVEAMSLYNHVKNKDDILDGLVELVVAEIDVPTASGDWREQMRGRAMSAHAILMKHPWATKLLMSRINIGPLMLRYVDATLGCLLAAGFDYALADHAWNTLDSYIYGFTLWRLSFPFEPDEYKDVAEEFMPQVPMQQYPHLAGLSLAVMQGRHDGQHDLSFGLELLLDGLERLRAPEKS